MDNKERLFSLFLFYFILMIKGTPNTEEQVQSQGNRKQHEASASFQGGVTGIRFTFPSTTKHQFSKHWTLDNKGK